MPSVSVLSKFPLNASLHADSSASGDPRGRADCCGYRFRAVPGALGAVTESKVAFI